MTRADFSALTESEKNPDMLYFVNDYGDFGPENLETEGEIYLGGKRLTDHVTPMTPGSVNFVTAGYEGNTTSAWAVTLPGLTAYYAGLKVAVYNATRAASTTTLTLNINQLGAVHIYRYGATAITALPAYSVAMLTLVSYNGNWRWMLDNYVNSTYDLRQNYISAYAPTTSSVGVFANSLCAFASDGTISSLADRGGTGASKQPANISFPIGAPIFYRNSSANYDPGVTISDAYILYNSFKDVDLRYSMNYVASRFPANRLNRIYLKVQVDADNDSWKPIQKTSVSDHIVTDRELETGCFYIFLGCSFSSTKYYMSLTLNHPLFYYDGTRLIGYDRWKAAGNFTSLNSALTALQNLVNSNLMHIDGISYPLTTTIEGIDCEAACINIEVLASAAMIDFHFHATLKNKEPTAATVECWLETGYYDNTDNTFIPITTVASGQTYLAPASQSDPTYANISMSDTLAGLSTQEKYLRVCFSATGSVIMMPQTSNLSKPRAAHVLIRFYSPVTLT